MLAETDLQAVTELARVCLSADGGQTFAANPGFLRHCYLSAAETRAGFSGAQLVCVSSLRRDAQGQYGTIPVTTGLVHPAWRRLGIGGHAFDWALALAGPGGLLAESEALSDGAHALYLGKGLCQVLAEDVMQVAASSRLPSARRPAGLTLSEWGEADPSRYYAVYQAAFSTRPAPSGRSQAQWVEWISDDEDFRAEWTLLATADGTDVGFIAAETTGWIAQLGVVPSARRRGIGSWLIAEAVQRMRSAGEGSITLNVGADNPQAAALYRSLGFTRIGRRARYQANA